MTERNNGEKGFVWRKIKLISSSEVKAQRKKGFRLNLMQCRDGPDHGREEAGAAADILLLR